MHQLLNNGGAQHADSSAELISLRLEKDIFDTSVEMLQIVLMHASAIFHQFLPPTPELHLLDHHLQLTCFQRLSVHLFRNHRLLEGLLRLHGQLKQEMSDHGLTTQMLTFLNMVHRELIFWQGKVIRQLSQLPLSRARLSLDLFQNLSLSQYETI